MNRALWRKSFGDARWLMLACATLLYGICCLRVWITSQLDMSRFETIIRHVPKQWQDLLPVPLEHLVNYTARIAMAYDDPSVVLLVAMWAITRGSDAVSGPIGRGTHEMIVGQPIGRGSLLFTHSTVTVLGLALLCLAAWAGTCTGISICSIQPEPVSPTLHIPLLPWDIPLPGEPQPVDPIPVSSLVEKQVFLPAVANLFSLGFLLTGLTTLMSSWDRYRWRTIGIMSGIYISQAIVKVIGLASLDWRWILRCTFFTPFDPQVFVALARTHPNHAWSFVLPSDVHMPASGLIGQSSLGPVAYDLILITIGLASFAAAHAIYARRDLPAPL